MFDSSPGNDDLNLDRQSRDSSQKSATYHNDVSGQLQPPEPPAEAGREGILDTLNRKLDNYYEKVHNDPTDAVIQDISLTIENFERLLIAYMNDKNRKHHERDVQRLIKDDLRKMIMTKLQDVHQAGNFSRCDPHKIQTILDSSKSIKVANSEVIEKVRQGITTLINEMVKTVEDMEKCNC